VLIVHELMDFEIHIVKQLVQLILNHLIITDDMVVMYYRYF